MFGKPAAISGMEEVLHIDIQRAFHCVCGGSDQTVGHVPLCHTIAFLQRFHDSRVMFLSQLPEPWLPRAFSGPGIRHIKDVFYFGFILAAINQADAGSAAANPMVHTLIPDWIGSHGGGIRALGVD
ncbi:MAG: hypothetical protein ABF904_12700 [Ethanoligenens sp.]